MQIRPTWSDYGTHAASAYPELWQRCVYAACPSLGPTGNRLYDLSVNNSVGTMTNMEPSSDWLVDNTGRYVLSFDGSDERVVAEYRPAFKSAGVTVSCWYYRTSSASSANGRGIVSRYGSSRSWLLYAPPVNDGHMYFAVSQDGTYIDNQIAKYSSVLANQTWHHLVGRLSPGSPTELYINGSLAATSVSSPTGLNLSSDTIELGNFFNGLAGTFFQGYIDDVMVWDYAIPIEHIRTLYQRGDGRGIAYTPRRTRKRYSTGSQDSSAVTGTVAVTLDNVTATASGTGGTSEGVNRIASVNLSMPLSASLSVG